MKYSRHTTCFKCQSDNTQSFEMVYNAGTSFGNINVNSYSSDEGFGFSGGSVSHQTVLASQLAPPEKPEWTIAQLIVIPALLLFGCFALWNFLGLIVAVVIGGGISFLFLYLIEREVKKKTPIYETAYARWKRAWICLRCGATWQLKRS